MTFYETINKSFLAEAEVAEKNRMPGFKTKIKTSPLSLRFLASFARFARNSFEAPRLGISPRSLRLCEKIVLPLLFPSHPVIFLQFLGKSRLVDRRDIDPLA